MNWLAKESGTGQFSGQRARSVWRGVVIDVRVKQALLRSVLPDGTVVLLVVLHDDRCAILRNSQAVHEAAGDADGIDGAVQLFMAMTQVRDVLGGADARGAMSRSVDDPVAQSAAAAAAARDADAPSAPSPGTSA
jgi:hypothetical protein